MSRVAGASRTYRALWAAVLFCTVEDAQGRVLGCDPKHNAYSLAEWISTVADARRWLLADVNPERTFVCDAAGIDEQRVVAWARTRMRSPQKRPDASPSFDRLSKTATGLEVHCRC